MLPNKGTYLEIVCKRSIGSDGALGDSRRPIHALSPLHIQAMPMYTCRLIAQVVVDTSNHAVALVDVNCRWWPLAIDANERPCEAIRGCKHPIYTPVIVRDLRHCQMADA